MKIYTKDEKIIAVETTFMYSEDISITMKCLTNCTVNADCTDSKEICGSILPRYRELAMEFLGSQDTAISMAMQGEEITIP